MVNVIAFPPVGVVGTMFTVAAPVQRSQSLITGKRFVSRMGRERREAMVNVSALSKSRSGAGYSEMLIRHLDGGANLVRLNSYPINWHLDQARLAGVRSSQLINWTDGGDALAWQNAGQPLTWFSGAVLTGVVTLVDGVYLMTVSGGPPNTLIARPGDFLKVTTLIPVDLIDQAYQIGAEARTNAEGVAVIRMMDPIPQATYPRVSIGESDSRVFEAVEMPRSPQPLGSNWFYQWNFREVFEDEAGEFVEVNPW